MPIELPGTGEGMAVGGSPSEPRPAPPGGTGGHRGALRRELREAPASLLALLALLVALALLRTGAGYDITLWAPAGIVFVALLVAGALAIPLRLRTVPLPVLVAIAALGAFTAWSFLSIAWAADQGSAWLGADRTLLYLVVFTLFALWPQRPRTAVALVGLWTAGMGILALVTVVRLGGSGAVAALFSGDRLGYPVDYPNAAAAFWLMPLWPAVALAATPRTPAVVRGALAAVAVLLLDLGLLTQSRGAAVATGVVALAWFALFGGRVRRLAIVVPVAAGVALAARTLVDVGTALLGPNPHAVSLAHAQALILAGAAGAGVVVAIGSFVAGRARIAPEAQRRGHRAVGAGAVAVLVGAAIVVVAVKGGPSHIAHKAWDSFKGTYATNAQTGPRLISGLGSNRYDFYRVGLDEFTAHPIAGTGADNFAAAYLRHGRSSETPQYPHSVEIRTLEQTGIVGGALLLAVLAAAAVAVARAARSRGGSGALVVAALAGPPLYWLVHGSVDWFWETAGLGTAAFAFLGLACALAPRRAADGPSAAAAERRRPGLLAAGVVVAAVVAIVSLAAPWLAERGTRQAAKTWPTAPAAAFRKLDTASSLNPLSEKPRLTEGLIAVELGDLRHADRAFAETLQRNPAESTALLERAAIASGQRRRAAAETLIRDASARSPRDPVIAQARGAILVGKRVDARAVTRALATGAAAFAK